MSATSEREAVGTLLAAWTATPIAWPNRDFKPPVGGEWITITLRQGEAFQLELGAQQVVHRHPGIVIVQVFAQANKGDKRALELSEGVAALFRRSRFGFASGGVVFRTPTIRAIGVDGGSYQVNVTTPFYRDVLY